MESWNNGFMRKDFWAPKSDRFQLFIEVTRLQAYSNTWK